MSLTTTLASPNQQVNPSSSSTCDLPQRCKVVPNESSAGAVTCGGRPLEAINASRILSPWFVKILLSHGAKRKGRFPSFWRMRHDTISHPIPSEGLGLGVYSYYNDWNVFERWSWC
jgi:hypothetical protein